MKLIDKLGKGEVIIFGTGSSATAFINAFPQLQIGYFVDNNREKWNRMVQNKIISPPERILNDKGSGCVVIASQYEDDIAKQLDGMGLRENVDYFRAQSVMAEIFGGPYEPGHFYSTIPDIQYVENNRSKLFNTSLDRIPGINLHEREQLDWLVRISKHYNAMPHHGEEKRNLRYQFENDFFRHTDAVFMYGLMRELQPGKVIEVGSGYTTALMLDILEFEQETDFELTAIEPYPDRLLSLVKVEDKIDQKLMGRPVQEVPLDFFKQLQAGDILFIDSSHVSKVGSDVNQLIFEVLPELNRGVYIHFHDVFYPFEYPESWIKKGRFWNEAYLLRAFLQFNNSFNIVIWNHYMTTRHFAHPGFRQMPVCTANSGGSLWLRKM